jgi:hypothetical protein
MNIWMKEEERSVPDPQRLDPDPRICTTGLWIRTVRFFQCGIQVLWVFLLIIILTVGTFTSVLKDNESQSGRNQSFSKCFCL